MRKRHLPRISRRAVETEMPIMQVMGSLNRPEGTIDLSQGIPFFGPPREAVDMAISESGSLNRYGPDAGDPDLRMEIVEKLSKRNGIPGLAADNVMVTAGANIAFLNAISAICDVGDNVILLDPYYFNHGMTLDILGVGHVHVPFEGPDQTLNEMIIERITERTRAIVLVSPNNPTGEVASKKMVQCLLEICLDHELWLISDETYEEFCYESNHVSPASLEEDLPVISLFSFSKSHGMSGWRQGYMAYPNALHAPILKVQDTTVICPSRIGQRLAYHCIRDHMDHTKNYIPELDRIRRKVIGWLDSHVDRITAPRPTGAFYSFPAISSEIAVGSNSMDLSVRILEETAVLLVPGRSFGADDPPGLRIAYGNVNFDEIVIALERLDEWIMS